MHQEASPNDRKRSFEVSADVENQTPTSVKRQKLEEGQPNASPSTPSALKAVASAISGVFGYGTGESRQPEFATNGSIPPTVLPSTHPIPSIPPKLPTPATSTPAKSRPSIKLAALLGTVWDNGNLPAVKKSSVPKSTGRSASGSPAAKGIGKGTSTGSLNDKSQAPKGILTPKKKRGRPRKNVTFNRGLDGEVYFEDLPKTPSSRKSKPPQSPKPDAIVCEICSKPDSNAPNEIILCDNCDFAVHQQCYDVPEIPEGEWLCKSCLQEDVLKTPVKAKGPTLQVPDVPKVVDVPDIPNLDQHLRGFQRVLLDRCSGHRKIKIFGQEEVYEKASQLVEQTVVAGESNSMLVIGPRGCGKTTLVENIILDLSKEHRQEFHVVRLNGFLHTDDKLALREIWRQLGKEMEVEDDLLNRTNHADTMASLLALLSHPSEIMGTDEGVTSQSVVFVIDEFDMFALHPRQTLLYNLLDIAQSRKAPIAVLGCTARLDVADMLEKRVKSRFSHRYVYLSPPKSLAGFWQTCRQGLMIDRPDAAEEGIDVSVDGYDEFHKYWNHKIEELYKQRPFQHLLQYHYFTSKSAAAFFTEWVLPLSRLSAQDLTLTIPAAIGDVTSLAAPDSRLQLLSALSDLDLSLLISAARLDIVAHADTVNFAMAHDEYSSLVGKQRVHSSTAGMVAMGGATRAWSRGVAGISWERLIALGLLVPAGIGGAKAMAHGGLDGKMWKVDVALEEIPTAVRLNTVLARWCREI